MKRILLCAIACGLSFRPASLRAQEVKIDFDQGIPVKEILQDFRAGGHGAMAQLMRLAQETPQLAPPQPAAKAVGGEELRIPAPEGIIRALTKEEMGHLRDLAIAIARESDPPEGKEGKFTYSLFVAGREDQPGFIVADRHFNATRNQQWRGGPTHALLFRTALNADGSQTIEEIWLHGADSPDFIVLPDGRIRYKNPGQSRPEAQGVLAGQREFWRQVPPSSVTRESMGESRKGLAREVALRELAEARKQTLAVLRREYLYEAEQDAREASDNELLREIEEEQRKFPRR